MSYNNNTRKRAYEGNDDGHRNRNYNQHLANDHPKAPKNDTQKRAMCQGWFDGPWRGSDCPSEVTEANKLHSIGEVLVMLTYKGEDANAANLAPRIVGYTLVDGKLKADSTASTSSFRGIIYSQDPGVQVLFGDGGTRASEDKNSDQKLKNLWEFNFRRQRMIVEDNLLRHTVRWVEQIAVPDDDEEMQDTNDDLEEGEVKAGSAQDQICQLLSKWSVHGGRMSEHPEVLDLIVESCQLTGGRKALEFAHFGYDPNNGPPCIPDHDPGVNGVPSWVKNITSEFTKYNQVTVVFRRVCDEKRSWLWHHLDSVFDKWTMHQGPFWHLGSTMDSNGKWRRLEEGELRTIPGTPGRMFSMFIDRQIMPKPEPWMRLGNAHDSNYRCHNNRIAFDDPDQIEFYYSMAVLFAARYEKSLWNDLFDGVVLHDISCHMVMESKKIRMSISLNKTKHVVLPQLNIGTAIQVMSISNIEAYRNSTWEGVVVGSWTKVTDDACLVVDDDQGMPLHEGTRFQAVLFASPNIDPFFRLAKGIARLVGSKNESILYTILNRGHNADHVHLIPVFDETGQPQSFVSAPALNASGPKDEAAWKSLMEDSLLNPEQRANIKQVLSTSTGHTYQQGPPGCGKTSSLARLVVAAALHGNTVIGCAVTNGAAEQIMSDVIPVYLKHVKQELRDSFGPFGLVYLNRMGELKAKMVQADNSADITSRMSQLANMFGKTGTTEVDNKVLAPDQDPGQREYYMLGAHIKRHVQHLIQPPKNRNPLQKIAKTWDLTVQKLEVGILLSDDEVKDFNHQTISFIEDILKHSLIIVSTSSNLMADVYRDILEKRVTGLICHDEAAYSSPAEAMAYKTLPHKSAFEVGDHKQLSGLVVSGFKNPYAEFLKTSLFKNAQDRSWPTSRLNIQYRMAPSINRFPAMTNYPFGVRDGKSTMGESEVFRKVVHWEEHCPFGQQFIDSLQDRNDGKDKVEEGRKMRRFAVDCKDAYAHGKGSSPSIQSFAVLNQAFRVLDSMLRYDPGAEFGGRLKPEDFALLTMYGLERGSAKRQAAMMKSTNSQLDDVPCFTVDGFQGKQARIVFVTLPAAYPGNGGQIGYMKEQARILVAQTRPKDLLIFFGNFSLWSTFLRDLSSNAGYFAELVVDLDDNQCIVDASKWDVNVSREITDRKHRLLDHPGQKPYWECNEGNRSDWPTRKSEIGQARNKVTANANVGSRDVVYGVIKSRLQYLSRQQDEARDLLDLKEEEEEEEEEEEDMGDIELNLLIFLFERLKLS